MSRGRIARKALFTLTLTACAAASAFMVLARERVLNLVTEQIYGITFSSQHAAFLGLDPHEVYTAMLDDLGVQAIRLPLYWPSVEVQDDVFVYDDVDWYLQEAAARGVAVTLVVGMKTPRWPECHIPAWLSVDQRAEETLEYVEQVVRRYQDHPAVYRWQVENEAYFPFGDCPFADAETYKKEIALVRSLDADTPIQLTVSGEQEPWTASAGAADVLGVSLYRYSYQPVVGAVVFPHTPEYYAWRRAAVGDAVDTLIVSELQAEPWFFGAIPSDVEERYSLFTAEQFKDNLAYAERTGIEEVYLWGVEWWYALYNAGEDRLWEVAKDTLKNE